MVSFGSPVEQHGFFLDSAVRRLALAFFSWDSAVRQLNSAYFFL
jgi:hypothetical protein